MKKLLIILAIVVAVVVILVAYGRGRKTDADSSNIKTAASFYIPAHFLEKAGGGKVDVYNVTPAGAESHDFEPTPQDIKKLQASRLFVYNGGGFDPWAKKVSANIEKAGIKTLNISKHFELLSAREEDHDHEHDKDGHGHGPVDPHVWLDPLLAIKEVKVVTAALQEIAPEYKAEFQKNSETYIGKLRELHSSYETGLAICEKRDLVVSHSAFSYLAKRYNMNVISISGLSTSDDPSPRRIGEISRLVKEKGIEYVFFETLVSPRIAQTIARETGAKTMVLNPIEGLTATEIVSGEDYISVMKKNLQNIRTALNCQ